MRAIRGEPADLDEEQLVRRVARGDRGAFEELYRRTSPWLTVRLRRRCSDDQIVAEVLQETYLAVWRAADAFAGATAGGSAVGWLWTIAARRLIDAFRRRAHHAAPLLGTPANGRLRPVHRRLGYLPQHLGFYKRFKVREFVEYLAWLKEMPSAEIPGAVDRALARVWLTDRAEDRMRSLSGGMIRRAGIAQAIVNDPEVLLLDEPTVGLDPAQRLRFRELVTELGQRSCVLISTHLVEDVAAACTDVVLVSEGSLVFQGTPGELATAGTDEHVGDSPIERGYSALISASAGGAW